MSVFPKRDEEPVTNRAQGGLDYVKQLQECERTSQRRARQLVERTPSVGHVERVVTLPQPSATFRPVAHAPGS